MSEDQDSASVVFPPPLIVWGAILAGWLIGLQWPLPLLQGPSRWWIGGALVVVPSVLSFFCFREFRRAETSIRPDVPTAALITTGPFRYSRNPLYLFAVLFQVGMGFLLSEGWVLLMLVPVLLILHFGVILREERYLERKFGQAYRDYRAAVRRWL